MPHFAAKPRRHTKQIHALTSLLLFSFSLCSFPVPRTDYSTFFGNPNLFFQSSGPATAVVGSNIGSSFAGTTGIFSQRSRSTA